MTAADAAAGAASLTQLGPARRRDSFVGRLLRNRRAALGLVLLLSFYATALLARWLAPFPPDAQSLLDRLEPPGAAHPLGTDGFGRDVLSRTLWAGQISQSIGLVAMVISTVLGVLVGALAGYYGRLVDNALMRFTDMLLAFPTFFLLVAVVAVFGTSVPVLVVVLGLTSWPITARVVRGEFLSLRPREFVTAARALGAGDARIAARHILPNVIPVIIVAATLRVAYVILVEAGLSYLGVGVQPPTPSWGNMVAEGRAVLTLAPWISLFPGLLTFLSVMAYNLVGDGLRDAFDPRMRLPRRGGQP